MRRLTPYLAALLLACSAGAPAEPEPILHLTPPGEVTLLQGQTAEVALPGAALPLFVTFTRITTDSRCPTNVQCVWAGEVGVELTLAGLASGDLTLYLPGGTSGPSTGSAAHYQIELTAVTPQPVSGAPQTEPDRITLAISPKP